MISILYHVDLKKFYSGEINVIYNAPYVVTQTKLKYIKNKFISHSIKKFICVNGRTLYQTYHELLKIK